MRGGGGRSDATCSICPASGPRLLQLPRQVRPHGRPFARDDAVDAGVAQRSIRRDLVAAEDAVELGAQSLDAAPALMIEKMGAEFDRDAAERLEGVAQKHDLAFGVDRRALNACAVPRAADLQAAMLRLDVEIVRHA